MEKFDDDAGADDADDADTDDDDDVKKKLGVVEGAFALLRPPSSARQTGSGDGSKEVLLRHWTVTKLFAHDGDDDYQLLTMIFEEVTKRPLLLYCLVTEHFRNGGEHNDEISECFRFCTIQREIYCLIQFKCSHF